jgi:23S rRNA (uracil1939-C5)-methyltransferase
VRAGYYQQGSHKIVNLNQCPVQPEAFDEILQQVKRDIEDCDWPIYDEKQHTGEIRHIGLRIGYHTGEMLLTLVTRGGKLPDLEAQAQHWLKGFPGLVGVTLNINPHKTNAIFGAETYTVAGSGVLNERFAGLDLELGSDTFFQVNTEAAEIMIETLVEGLKLQSDESLLDAYCGIGTFTLPLAKAVKQAIGIEVHERSVDRAEANAMANGIENAFFYSGRVEDRLFQVASDRLFGEVDAVILDPPRQGCDPIVIDALRRLKPKRIGYASCKPATLARDLKLLCEGGLYSLDRVQPIDLFPHTSHVESIAFLTLDPEMAAVRTITKVE